MGTVSLSLPSDGTTADVADFNTPLTTLKDEFNGNIDNANIKSGAAIDGSKLADTSISRSKLSFTTFDPVLYAASTTSETTTSTSFANTTQTAAVTGTFTCTRVKVTIGGTINNSSTSDSVMSYAVSGATTIASSAAVGIQNSSSTFGTFTKTSVVTITPGSNTFTLQKRVTGNTGTFFYGSILVEPIPNPSS